MKVILCVLGALILLSSLTSIFNNLVIGDASAEQYPYSQYPTEEYKYECQTGPFEGFFVSSVEFCDIKIHDDRKDFKKIDDDRKDFKDTKFTCPGSGLVVDKEANCPIICPTGTALAGHLVKAGSVIAEACSVDTPLQQTCDDDTDLPGVLVEDETTDCDIFATCDADDPLGIALELTGTETVEVADIQLCALEIPEAADVSIATNAEAQCLKCADLSVFAVTVDPSNANNILAAESSTAAELRGVPATTPPTNIFTVCNDPDTAKRAFDARVTNTGVVNAFNACLDAAAANPGTGDGDSIASSQENSLTTNIQSEAEIPSVNAEPQNANLNSLLENPDVKALLENPDLNSMLENPDLNSMLENPDVKALLENPEVKALLETQK
jgi:hypothetical protein